MTSLLPSDSTTAFEDALASSMARLSDVPVPIATIKVPQETDARTLTALGWEWSVNEWQSSWSTQRRRDVVDASPAVHRVLGTAGAVRKAIAALGYGVIMQEWFEYEGDPYHFHIAFDLDAQTLTTPDYLMLQRTALDAKNVRSFFDGFSATRTQPGKISYGFGMGGTAERSFQPLEKPVYRFDGYIGAGIGVLPGPVAATFEPLT